MTIRYWMRGLSKNYRLSATDLGLLTTTIDILRPNSVCHGLLIHRPDPINEYSNKWIPTDAPLAPAKGLPCVYYCFDEFSRNKLSLNFFLDVVLAVIKCAWYGGLIHNWRMPWLIFQRYDFTRVQTSEYTTVWNAGNVAITCFLVKAADIDSSYV